MGAEQTGIGITLTNSGRSSTDVQIALRGTDRTDSKIFENHGISYAVANGMPEMAAETRSGAEKTISVPAGGVRKTTFDEISCLWIRTNPLIMAEVSYPGRDGVGYLWVYTSEDGTMATAWSPELTLPGS